MDDNVIFLAEKLSLDTSFRVVFAVDERRGSLSVPERFEKISLTADELIKCQLAVPLDVGWRCGDYFFYLVSNKIAADFYWIIEPDVYINFDNYNDFFSSFDRNYLVDFIAAGYRLAEPSWSWVKTLKSYNLGVYGCLFPLVRLSARAIKHLYKMRQIFSNDFINENQLTEFPNDECFVASILSRDGYVCKGLNEFGSEFYQYGSTFVNGRVLSRITLSKAARTEKVYHPVETGQVFQQKMFTYVNNMNSEFAIMQLEKSLDDIQAELGVDYRRNVEYLIDLEKTRIAEKNKSLNKNIMTAEGFLVNIDFNRRIFIFINNRSDYIQKFHLKGVFYEQSELTEISKYFPVGGVFVDVGSHTGNHSIYVGKYLEASSIIAFEPNDDARLALHWNVSINGLSEIVDLRYAYFALGRQTCEGYLECDPQNWGAGIVTEGVARFNTQPVHIKTGDAILTDQKIDFIKIDVARGTLDILDGLSETIRRCRPNMMITVAFDDENIFEIWLKKQYYQITSKWPSYGKSHRIFLRRNVD